MKTPPILLIIILGCLSIQSCFVNRYQKVQTTWEKAKPGTSTYMTPDSILRVTYSMWETQGTIVVKIQNQTDSLVYINPWYIYNITQQTDTHYLELPHRILVKRQSGQIAIDELELENKLYYGDEIPIPVKGTMEIKTACINCYLQLDYEDNDPVTVGDSIIFYQQNTPFQFENRIGYAFPSDTNLRVVRHVGYVSKIDRYRFVWTIEDIPAGQKEDRSFYIHSKRPSVVTWLGMVGLGAIYVLGSLAGEE